MQARIASVPWLAGPAQVLVLPYVPLPGTQRPTEDKRVQSALEILQGNTGGVVGLCIRAGLSTVAERLKVPPRADS